MALDKRYYNFFDICKWEGIPIGTAKGKAANGLEGIKSLEALKPIGHLFRKFESKDTRNQYGILRTHYDFWKRTGEPPKVSPGRPPKWKNNPNLININIPFPKDLYRQFQQVVDNANSLSVVKVAYRDMFAVAVKEFVERRPQFLNSDGDNDG